MVPETVSSSSNGSKGTGPDPWSVTAGTSDGLVSSDMRTP